MHVWDSADFYKSALPFSITMHFIDFAGQVSEGNFSVFFFLFFPSNQTLQGAIHPLHCLTGLLSSLNDIVKLINIVCITLHIIKS